MENLPRKQNSGVVSKDEMAEALLREEIIVAVAKQLDKDFGMWGMDITFSNDIPRAYDELFEQVYGYIMALGTSDLSKLKNLLYQIDINPATVAARDSSLSLEEELSHRIIERELQKVLLRKFYK